MNIPIRNIYHMLCYAWDFVQDYQAIPLAAERWSGIPELFAFILIGLTSNLVRRGLHRSYIQYSQAVSEIQGKIDIPTTIRTALRPRQLLQCEYDDLSHDICSNQIIKATFLDLLKCKDLQPDLKKRCEALYRRLSHISNIALHGGLFRTVQVHRNNRIYRFLLDICRLVYECKVPTEERGVVKFSDFRKDETVMRRLYEQFIRSFYRYHAKEYEVKHPQVKWAGVSGVESALDRLPLMQTDLVLKKEGRYLIIEAKFTPRIMGERFGIMRLRSPHLYQIYAYLKNASYNQPKDALYEGMLLYPVVSNPASYDYSLPGAKLHIRSINLNQEWESIHQDLLRIIA